MLENLPEFVSSLLAQAPSGGGGSLSSSPFGFMVLMFVGLAAIYYTIVLRPQKTEQKQRQDMLDNVGKGDHAVTIGGIHGTIEAVDTTKGIVSLTVAPKTVIRVNKSALSSVTPKGKGGDSKDEPNGSEK